MPVHNFAFPVRPGKEDLARKFAAEVYGEHADHYADLMTRSGTTRVTWTLNETPAGTFVLVWYEADEVFAIFTSSPRATTTPRTGCAAESRRPEASS